MIKSCRVLICTRDDAPAALTHDSLHLLPRIKEGCYPFEGYQESVQDYTYLAPECFERAAGMGVLFENDWCNGDDVYFLVQSWNADKNEWIDVP